MKNRTQLLSCKPLLFLTLSLFISPLTAQTPEISWWFDMDDSAFGTASAADIDGDDTLEVVFGCYRNDGYVYALNGENGSLLWKRNLAGDFEGCNDAAPLVFDVDMDGEIEIVVAASCNPTTFCFNGVTGISEWEKTTYGSDSPPTVGDVDNDGKYEILHGNFAGGVTCLNGENGSFAWDFVIEPNGWIQTAPILLDVDNNDQLDFIVANLGGEPNRIACYRGDNHQLIWENTSPTEGMYHGASFADLDGDGFAEIVIGCYDGNIYCINANDGSEAWTYALPSSFYTIMATSIADLNQDGKYEVVFFDYDQVAVLSHTGSLLWTYEMANFGQCFRGAAISDVTGDEKPDVVFASDNGNLYALHGASGALAFEIDLKSHYGDNRFELDQGPLIADFDLDGDVDIFVAGGFTEYPDFQNNFGRAYMVSTNSNGGPDWLMFRRDSVRSGAIPIGTVSSAKVNIPDFQFSAFPNPANEFIIVESELSGTLQMFDILGRAYREEDINKKLQVDLNGIPHGLYILRILTKEGYFREKLLTVVRE